MTEIRIRFSRPRRQGTTEPAQPPTGTDGVVESDDGLFQIGLEDDAAEPFPSRTFAAVASQTRRGQTTFQTGRSPGIGQAAYAAPAHSSHFTGAQPASSTTSNSTSGKLAALEQGRRVYRMTMVIQNLGAEIKRELTCLPLNEEGAEHGQTKKQTPAHDYPQAAREAQICLPEGVAAGHHPAAICKDGGVVAG